MDGKITLYLFGDQSEDIAEGLRSLICSVRDPILDAFLTKSYEAIRSEFQRIPWSKSKSTPKFASLLDLLALQKGGFRSVPLSHALTMTYQIGLFIRQCHISGAYPHPTDSYLVGICTGTLAAAAISCSQSLSDLLPAAISVISIAFRAGLLASDVGARVVPSTENTEASWGMIYPGLSLEKANAAIKVFSESQCLPLASRPYVSSSSNRGVTVSGPPRSLLAFQSHEGVSKFKAIKLSLNAPYHAAHLYSHQDIESVLDIDPVSLGREKSTSIPILSISTGEIVQAHGLRSLLQNALSEIFLRPMQWDLMADSLGSVLKATESTKTLIIPISTEAGPGLKAVLKMKGNTNIEVADHPLKLTKGEEKDITFSATGGNSARSKIAIIGMSGRFPKASDAAAFWDIIYKGLDVHEVVPPLRWDARTHVDTSGTRKNTSATPYGCWLEDPGLFDARFFGMSPREAFQVDPAQRLALMTAYEALEQAGIVPDNTPSTRKDRVGVFFGVTSNDWMETNSAQDIDTYFIPGGNRAFIPGRINYCFKFSGPSYSVDTACSSSLAAIHVACNSLWQGDVDTAIAGGTNVLTNPDFTSGLDRGHFLSRTGNCKTFDDSADGYCRGEGVGTVILKRLEDAIADNDPIQGVILNVSTNHSADSDSITRPNIGAQKEMFQKVLSGTKLSDVSYVEMHGTGTQTGDAAEMSSVLECFAPKASQRPGNQVLYLGSAKANVGHGEAAAGVTSLAKVLLMMRHDIIPPHCGIKTSINRKFPEDLMARGVRIADKPVKWEHTQGKPRRALVNNFSAAGGNTALLLEDAPRTEPGSKIDPRTTHLVTASAKTASALKANAQALLLFLRPGRSVPLALPSLSYTTTARRIHHPHRISVTGSSVEDIIANLAKAIDSDVGKTRPVSRPSVVFTFTGQGSSYFGMGKDLFESISSFRTDISRYDQLGQAEGFPAIIPVICGEEGSRLLDQSPVAIQLALTCLQMALVKLWASWGINPNSVMGHSLGHYAALNAAGVLSEADTIYLVGVRARELEKSCSPDTHLMLAVKASLTTLAPFLKDQEVEVACCNGSSDYVLSGARENIEDLSKLLASEKIISTTLKTPYAFHSSQVDCILEDFKLAARGVTFHAPAIPVICPLSGAVIRLPGFFGPQHLADHCRKPVNIVGALSAATKDGVVRDNSIFLEIGPHPTVSRMVKSVLNNRSSTVSSLSRDIASWKSLTETLSTFYLAGAEINWKEFHRDFASCCEVIDLPAYNWDLKDYWIKYINDWSLRKGDALPLFDAAESERLRILSTTIHRVVSEEVGVKSGSMTVESDIHRADLYPLVQGHKVNGIPLCTPSVYADIGLSVGRYLRNKYQPAMEEQQIDIANMSIEKALIAQPQGPQLLHTTVDVDWQKKSASCHFSSVDKNGKIIVAHASCTILFTFPPDPQWLEKCGAECQLQISRLETGLTTDASYKFNKSMIYRMVDTLAEFDPEYRALTEVVLDSEALEAASKIDMNAVKHTSSITFHTHPAYIDSFSQAAGFVMNANDKSDPSREVFVNHGWGSFQLFEPLDPDKIYRSHVKMIRGQGSIWEGTLIILDGERPIGKFEQIQLQGVPKRLLHSILQTASRQQSSVKTPQSSKISPANAGITIVSSASLVPGIHVAREVVPPSIDTTQVPFESSIDLVSKIVADKQTKILEIVSEETGIDIHELNDETSFAAIGVDSLLSLIIASRLKEDLDFETESGISIFDQFSTVGELKQGLAQSMGISETQSSSPSSTDTDGETQATTPSPTTVETQSKLPVLSQESLTKVFLPPDEVHSSFRGHVRPPSSVVLQRASSESTRKLFLFPDGSGSASSYANIPRISKDLTVVALVCPYMRDPEEMKCSFDDLVTGYLGEIKKRQPAGPYNLGGWSAGGVFAYRATQRLISEGEVVESLVLIDSPVPKGMDRLPQAFYDHCSAVGIFGQIGSNAGKEKMPPPKWLVPHFNATIDMLHEYWAEPLPIGLAPKTSIIWASQCALDGVKHPKLPPSPEDNEGMKFLTEKRNDFTAGGWADLFPGSSVVVQVAEEADHFSMMNGEHAVELAGFLCAATSISSP
ncbi:Non-reducing polyketide synthase [Lachnellula suecica]|uniref:Non-reducing polyketide synthase n=1 Tax=Lachnellula suecica TaxID=602035 RepID=A0A8T9CDS6_9HELO|nr:Non-reducing polyketide synthase [Lachnellula suecica]